ncbi:MAG: DNA gyrase/topoisomerase IV subunit A [Alistipes sp.]|nr:DNA gyrase/topoisomerase IV subunit A [Alistipes sp.]
MSDKEKDTGKEVPGAGEPQSPAGGGRQESGSEQWVETTEGTGADAPAAEDMAGELNSGSHIDPNPIDGTTRVVSVGTDKDDRDVCGPDDAVPRASKYDKVTSGECGDRYKLTGMYRDWFLDYASYVILERAVPHLEDGLKPVHRRILHAMKRLDDGRYNKVANIIGHTMQFHPHGDASIGDALVQLGQKDLLVDTQGNWGNILTGDEAAAPRYIEARLSKFALEVVFNSKTTEWMLSYDGRNQEPVTLPVKFPLLLAQGVEGIAVGLASKILPHNFNELIDACIAYLRGKEFTLYPDFPTGGMIDVSRYNDGLRGGAVKIRARISKVDRKTLAVTEIPFGTTTESIKESIIRANDRGKIKIKKVDDNTADKVEILIHVSNDESSDKTIDALYAFTDCEVSISPNSCIIENDKPHFMGVSEILKRSAEHTKYLLGRELEIRLGELEEQWHMASLERIFIENKMYEAIEGCKTREAAYKAVDKRLEPFKKKLRREVTQEDIVKLTELKFIRISRFDSAKADEQIKGIEDETAEVKNSLANLTDHAVEYYKRIKSKYGKGRDRRTEIREFDSIEAAKVVVANSKLYVDRAEGFFGIGNAMKKEEYVCDCSDMDDIIVITKEGKYIVTKVSDKAFFAKNIYYIGVFKRNDERTIYNVLYRDGRNGNIMMKRCAIKSITRDREYDLTKGTPKSEILYMSVNPNGEAEVLKVYFRPRPRLKKCIVDLDFSTLAIKGRQSQGNLFSRYGIQKIVLKEAGTSTLGGQNIWYDEQVRRLNTDGHGELLGEFAGNDRIMVITSSGKYYTTGFELTHHFPDDTLHVEKYDPDRIYSVAYYDADQKFYYLKRFTAPLSDRTVSFVDDENPKNKMVAISEDYAPVLEITFGGRHASRPPEQVDAETFIGVKSAKAKGKRLTTLDVSKIKFIEPRLKDNPDKPVPGDDGEGPQGDQGAEPDTVDGTVTPAGDNSGPETASIPEQAEVETAGPAEPVVPGKVAVDDDIEFVIERPAPDDAAAADSPQLGLF